LNSSAGGIRRLAHDNWNEGSDRGHIDFAPLDRSYDHEQDGQNRLHASYRPELDEDSSAPGGCDCAPAAWLPQNMGTAPCPQTKSGQLIIVYPFQYLPSIFSI
jgi:hypothetical protein